MTRLGRVARRMTRKFVELVAVGTGVCILAALASINVPVLLACVLLENALLGLWFALKCKKAAPVRQHPERPSEAE